MNYENIAIVFGPTLMRPDTINSEPALVIKSSQKEQKIIEILIRHFYSIFEK
jgi:hypothetical protein